MKVLNLRGNKINLIVFAIIICNLPKGLAIEPKFDVEANTTSMNEWSAVPDITLDALRAGFVLSNGVVVNISFDKRVFINDIEQSNSFFETPKNVPLVKNGELNISSDFSDSVFQSVIQNTLDNQVLKTIHTINIDIKNLSNARNALNNSDFYNQYFLPGTHQ